MNPKPQIQPIKLSEMAESTMFKVIWTTLPRRSFVSDQWLRIFEGTPFFFNMFAHVLPKAQNKFPYFRFYLRNIVLLSPDEHFLWDNGTEEARISYALDVEDKTGGKKTVDWNKLKDLEADLRKEYQKYFPSTIGTMIGCKYSLSEQNAIIGELNKQFLDSLIIKP